MRWQGVDLQNLLTKSIDELMGLYPGQSKKNLQRRKQEYKKKLGEVMERGGEKSKDELDRLAEAFKEAGINFSKEDLAQADRAGFHVGYIRNSEGEIEYTKPLPHIDFGKKGKSDFTENWLPATPARITPSRRKPVERDYKVIFAYGDLQAGFREIVDPRTNEREYMPLHDVRAAQVARYICRDARPDTIVNLSDSVDLSSLSRFKKDSNHFSNELGMAFQYIHNHYAELRADNPQSRIVEVASNHNQRLNDFVLQNFPQAFNLYRPDTEQDYPILSYPYLANLKHVNVEWIGGYPAGEFVYGEEYGAPPIVFRHGTETSSNGTVASKIMKNRPETHNVQGHSHETGEAWHTTRDGRYLGSFAVGALCRLDGVVPSYWSAVGDDNRPVHYQEKWQQSVLLIRDFQNGEYEFQPVMIKDGKAYYNGKEYSADE